MRRFARMLGFHTRLLALFAMLTLTGDGGDSGGGDSNSGSSKNDDGGGDEAHAQAIAQAEAAAAAKAKADVEASVAETLGMSPAEAKKILDAKNAADREAMTEAERIKAEAEDKAAAADKAKSEAETAIHNANVTAALSEAGVTDNPGALVPLVVVDTGADAAAIKAAVDTLLKERPGLVDKPGPADHSIGGRGSAGQNGGDTSTAKERAKKRADDYRSRNQRPRLEAVN